MMSTPAHINSILLLQKYAQPAWWKALLFPLLGDSKYHLYCWIPLEEREGQGEMWSNITSTIKGKKDQKCDLPTSQNSSEIQRAGPTQILSFFHFTMWLPAVSCKNQLVGLMFPIYISTLLLMTLHSLIFATFCFFFQSFRSSVSSVCFPFYSRLSKVGLAAVDEVASTYSQGSRLIVWCMELRWRGPWSILWSYSTN